MNIATFDTGGSSYWHRWGPGGMIMAEERKEGWPEASRALRPDATSASVPPPVRTIPTREAMSWIRALANDWEDERSRPPGDK
jgi:hypothetical protein